MKRYYIAAATLLIGTSAFAWVPSSEPVAMGKKDMVEVATLDAAADTAFKPAMSEVEAAKVDTASWNDSQAKLVTASAATWQDEPAADPDLDLAEPLVDGPVVDTVEVAEVPADTFDTAKPAMGGPLETVETVAALDLSTRPAAGNYPPCQPGPGDDNCIQLYEPGVRAQLASWSQPTGGLIGDAPATAMGGPYEPIEGASGAAAAMNGDGTVDTAMGETADVDLAQTAGYTGMGGPVAETGYPPCSPGPGDDRCIQLYERGVTGAGN